MNLIDTVPSGHGADLVRFSFGNMPFVDTYTFTDVTTVGGFDFVNWSGLRNLAFPNLSSIDPSNFQGGGLFVNSCSQVISLVVTHLATVGGNIVVANNASIPSVSFPALTSINGFLTGGTRLGLAVGNNASCASVSFPVLTHCGGQMELSQLPVGCTVSFPSLVDIQGQLISTSTNVATLSFPSLTTITSDTLCSFSPGLVTFSAPNWLPTPNKTISFSTCPNLSQATVNHILARCVANPSFAGASSQVFLDGPSPSGQGITDKATLIGRGCTVATN